MMKLKSILFAILAIAILDSCGDEKPELKFFFKADGKTYSLNKAHVYITDEYFDGDQIIRELVITDGTWNDNSSEFVNENYNATILLGEPDGEEASLYYRAVDEDLLFSCPPDASVAYFTFANGSIDCWSGANDLESGGVIHISGGFGNDDLKTIEFTNIPLEGLDGTTASFYFKGRISDEALN